MIIGTLRLRLYLRDVHSLKEKRRLLKSLKDRLSQRYNISVAEVDHQDVWQTAEIGIAAVGSEGRFIQEVLSKVGNFVRLFGGVDVTDEQQEIYPE